MVINKKVVINGLWIISEKFFSVIGTLLVTIYTARYLGAEKIGYFTYALSTFLFISPLSSLGSQNLVFDRTSKKKSSGESIIIASEALRTFLFVCLSVPFYFFVIYEKNEFEYKVIAFILLLYTYFQAKDIYPGYFNAVLKSKTNVISNQIGLILSQALRVFLILFSAPYYLFAIPYLLLTFIPYIIKKIKFNKVISKRNFKNNAVYNKYILSAGLPLALSSISILIYTRVGQIFLANNSGMTELGYYAAASTISQSWVFLPNAVIIILMNRVLNDKKDRDIGFSFIFFISVLISLIVCVFIYFFGGYILSISFGKEFMPAIEILNVLAFSNLFAVIGVVGYRIIISKGGYNYLFKKAIIFSLINIPLSYLLICHYGLEGAALAILITEALSCSIGNYFYKNGYILRVKKNALISVNIMRNFRNEVP